MPKILLLIFAVLMTVLFKPQTAQAQETRLVMAGISGVLKTEPIQLDNRVERLTAFLEKYDSPLVPYALDNPYKIGPVYAPPSSTWADKVTRFMKEIENFSDGKKIASLALTI